MRENPRACKTIDEIQVGDRIELTYVVTDDDLRKFAEISGDWNPIHFDDNYAAKSIFGHRIAHGFISVAKFSGIFGMDLPGEGTLWETQEVKFLAPVLLNKKYRAIAEATAKDRRRVSFSTWVEDDVGTTVLQGKSVVIPVTDKMRQRIQSNL